VIISPTLNLPDATSEFYKSVVYTIVDLGSDAQTVFHVKFAYNFMIFASDFTCVATIVHHLPPIEVDFVKLVLTVLCPIKTNTLSRLLISKV
jgi:hypothetical protein